MPYDIFNTTSIADAWNKSAFNQARDNEAQAAMAEQQKQLLASIPPQPVVQQTVIPEMQQAVPKMTNFVEQGAVPNRKPTAQEYETRAINYLMNKGYNYDDALQLMAPRIQMYKAEEAAENRQRADALAAQLDRTPIDSPEYRAGALQLYRLDPQIGGLYMKDGIGRREMYVQDRNRQNKREDMQYNADFQLRNSLQRMQAAEAYKQQLAQNKINQLVQAGYDPRQATLMVLGMGGRGNRVANDNNSGLLTGANLKIIENEYNKMLEQVQDGTLPESERGRFMYYGRMLKQNADALAGYNPAPNLQALFDQQVSKFGYSDDLVKAFKNAAAEKGYNLSDKDIATLTEKHKKA